MAGSKPSFLTGANAKIIVNDKTLAFAKDVSYSVKVQHAEPTVLGMYEATSIEPLGYKVTGTFTVVRYVADAIEDVGGKRVQGVVPEGNGVGNWGKKNNITDGRAHEALNPKMLNKSTGFDIEIKQKTPGGGSSSVAKIRGARIVQADFSLTKKNVAQQTFIFSALYADEDSFIADFSGSGQQFN